MTAPQNSTGVGSPDAGGVLASPGSIDGGSHILIEVAGLLEARAADLVAGTVASPPAAHHEVGLEVDNFLKSGDVQYRNGTAMITALSTKLNDVKHGFVMVDNNAAALLDTFIQDTEYVPPRR